MLEKIARVIVALYLYAYMLGAIPSKTPEYKREATHYEAPASAVTEGNTSDA